MGRPRKTDEEKAATKAAAAARRAEAKKNGTAPAKKPAAAKTAAAKKTTTKTTKPKESKGELKSLANRLVKIDKYSFLKKQTVSYEHFGISGSGIVIEADGDDLIVKTPKGRRSVVKWFNVIMINDVLRDEYVKANDIKIS